MSCHMPHPRSRLQSSSMSITCKLLRARDSSPNVRHLTTTAFQQAPCKPRVCAVLRTLNARQFHRDIWFFDLQQNWCLWHTKVIQRPFAHPIALDNACVVIHHTYVIIINYIIMYINILVVYILRYSTVSHTYFKPSGNFFFVFALRSLPFAQRHQSHAVGCESLQQ